MANSSTITVTTVVRDAVPSVVDFSTIGLVAFVAGAFVGYRSYDISAEGLEAMLGDGISQTSEPYLLMQAMASQDTHSETLKVYSRAAANAQSYTFTPTDTTEGHTVGVTLLYGGVEYDVTYEVQSGDTATEIVTGLIADAGVVTGLTFGGTTTFTVTLTDETDGERFYIKDLLGLSADDTSADAGIAADLAAAQAADPDFYGAMIDSTSAAEITAAAVWMAANTKLFMAVSVDTDNTTLETGVAYDHHVLTNHRIAVFVTKDSVGHGPGSLMSKEFAQAPGSDNWAHKQLTGQVADSWTQTELNNLRDNYALTYITELGEPHTLDGFAASGRYLDITRGVDWIEASIKAAELAVFLNNEKVPYTDAGAALLENALRGVLGTAETRGFLAPGWVVTRPSVASQSAADKAARRFPNLRWNGVLQGAINSVTVSGTVVI